MTCCWETLLCLLTSLLILRAFAWESVAVLRRTLPETIGVALEIGDEDPCADADPTGLQQVLVNLVLNARDAMARGGTLRLALSRVVVEAGGTSYEFRTNRDGSLVRPNAQ